MSTATAVQPERILKDLQQLWAQMAVDQADSGGVLRACAMTVVVVAENASDADTVRQTVGVLMHNHPSRAVILRPGGGAADLDARIFAECWKPFGKSQQICSEGIEITAGQGGFLEVAKFLVPLRVPDLPVVLWCRGTHVFTAAPELEPLFPLADKIIFDTSRVADADSALQFLRRLRGRGRRVADLHWTRLTGWREVLAHLFDDHALRPDEVKAAQVTFGGPSVTTCARYFAAWIRTALPAVRVAIAADASRHRRWSGGDPFGDALHCIRPPHHRAGRKSLPGSVRMRPALSIAAAIRIGRLADAGGAGHPRAGHGL